MPSFLSIDEFLGRLRTLQRRLPDIERQAFVEAGELLVEHAKAMIGEEIPQWPPLAQSTIEEKTRLGFTGRISSTDPEYRSGELRNSISSQADRTGVTLGSTDPIAPYQERGTSRIPPRPFISSTLHLHGREAAELVAQRVVAAVGFRQPRRRRHRQP